jgi:dipeptidyl aminopeptidase/acylaminoacyl peptidase
VNRYLSPRTQRIRFAVFAAAITAALIAPLCPTASAAPISNELVGVVGDDIMAIDTSTGAIIDNLTRTPDYEEANPVWSPDHRRIAFLRRESVTVSGWTICIMNADGSHVVTLPVTFNTPVNVLFFHRLSWSPDGTSIVFSDAVDISTVDLVDNAVRVLGPGYSPAWSPPGAGWSSPNGSLIVYSLPEAGLYKSDLWTMRPDGSGAHRLAATGRGEWTPVWRPDAARIGYLWHSVGVGEDTWFAGMMGALGQHPHAIMKDLNLGSAGPAPMAWSPDGTAMMVSGCRVQTQPAPRVCGLYRADGDGKNRQRLSDLIVTSLAW